MFSFKMRLSGVTLYVLVLFVMMCSVCADEEMESRGKKKKKFALALYFIELLVKKVFVLKLVYAFLFWLALKKAGFFFGWFVTYLREKKVEYIDHDHHHDHHDHYPHQYKDSFDHGDSYSPYRRKAHGI